MKTLKFTVSLILCLCLTAFTSNQAEACCRPDVRLSGPSSPGCPGSSTLQVYTINATCSQFTTVTVTGGTIVAANTGSCPVETPSVPTTELSLIGVHSCSFSVTVSWAPGGGTIIASAGESSHQITFTPGTPAVDISGPSGMVCQSTTSASYYSSVSGVSGASRLWTVTNGGGAPSVNIDTPTAPSTYMTGFTSGQAYYVTHSASCNGNVVASATLQLLTIGACFDGKTGDDGQVADVDVVQLKADDQLMMFGTEEERALHDRMMQSQRKAEDELQVYPNPVRRGASLFLKFTESEELTAVRIIDASGKVIKNMQTSDVFFEVNTTSLPAGMYFLQIENATGKEVRKLSIIN